MRIATDVRDTDVVPALVWIDGLIGAALDKRIASLRQQAARNDLLGVHFQNAYAHEIALVHAREELKRSGRLLRGPSFDLAYAFAVATEKIYDALPTRGKKSLKGRLLDMTKSVYGARPLAFEITIATHLMHGGWDVDFMDLCGEAEFDLLASRQQAAIELECKTTSGDTGRKIHGRELNRLGKLLVQATIGLLEDGGCHLVRVTVPDRLGKKETELDAIAAAVAAAIDNGYPVRNEYAEVAYSTASVAEWPNPREDGAHDFFENLFGVQNRHLIVHGRANHAVVAILVESTRSDDLIAAVAADAKEAADQCSSARPAIIAIQLVDQIGRSDLEELLRTPNGLHLIAHQVFKDTKRAHVDSIVYAMPQTIVLEDERTTRASGDSMSLFNPNARFDCPDARTIFRVAKDR